MTNACRRVPAAETADIVSLVNGPEGVHPRQRVRARRERRARPVRRSRVLRPRHRGRGRCRPGDGRSGSSTASPSFDTWKMDIRRFGAAVPQPRATPCARAVEVYSHLLRHPLPERGAPSGPAAAALARLPPPRRARVRVRREERVGATQLVRAERGSSGDERSAPARLGRRALERRDRRRGARVPRPRGALRRDQLLEDGGLRARAHRRSSSGSAPTTSIETVGVGDLHPAAATSAAASSATSPPPGWRPTASCS